jgi:hypothetical protein
MERCKSSSELGKSIHQPYHWNHFRFFSNQLEGQFHAFKPLKNKNSTAN